MAETLRCGLCGAGRPRGSCHIIVPTEKEKQDIVRMGQTPENEYVYCKPCWRTLSDPVQGPSVMKGLAQTRLQQLGVSDAEPIAKRYYGRLVEAIQKRRS